MDKEKDKEKMSRNKAVVPSLSGEKEIGFDYQPQDNGIWRITVGGKEAVVRQEDLFALVFYAADADQLDKLTPIQNTEVRIYARKHKIQLKRDMKKGEFVVARCEIQVPILIENGLKGLIGKTTKGGIIKKL